MTNAPLNGANLRGAVDLSSLVRPASPAPGAPGAQAPAAGGVVRSSTDSTFTEVLELSSTVPVIVEFYGQGVEASLADFVTQYGGRFVLVTVDASTNPQLVQAFQVQQVPTVAAVVGGRPVQLFTGVLAEPELREIMDQVLQLAAQNNVTGSIQVPDEAAVDAEPVEEPLPPHHQEAFDAISAGDFATAIKEYETAIAQNPRDSLAVAGLAQVSLLARLDGTTAEAVRAAAAASVTDVDAQLAVADLDVAGGHLDDAFARLLDLFPCLDADGKNRVRARILDYFEIAGADDERVGVARRRLTLLLY
ncbi:tetratricopeptide repeat protein [Salinibacterium sp. G-O1]|uniref:co-chaperone YbbN n=1 Tax=Salinibacterium sp. G-O1 TaxID=3046208 RepID=UPI0024BA6998|nr:tetratricopeptide repeat protein [Salinibacterium sp. G-O1]MDJ0335661.1 tetratricopeptide repeat protein [Salinibacterium sp. G-O1]